MHEPRKRQESEQEKKRTISLNTLRACASIEARFRKQRGGSARLGIRLAPHVKYPTFSRRIPRERKEEKIQNITKTPPGKNQAYLQQKLDGWQRCRPDLSSGLYTYVSFNNKPV